MGKKNPGSSLDDFLREEGVFEETEALVAKEVKVRPPAARRLLTKGASKFNIISGQDINSDPILYGLEFLLAFDGRIHHLEEGYWLKFEIKRVRASEERPRGLSYSFTVHAPDGSRLVGFDNAHGVPRSSKFKRPPTTHDHRHGPGEEQARPYAFKNAETLLDDFFREAERVLKSRGVGMRVVRTEEKGNPR